MCWSWNVAILIWVKNDLLAIKTPPHTTRQARTIQQCDRINLASHTTTIWLKINKIVLLFCFVVFSYATTKTHTIESKKKSAAAKTRHKSTTQPNWLNSMEKWWRITTEIVAQLLKYLSAKSWMGKISHADGCVYMWMELLAQPCVCLWMLDVGYWMQTGIFFC